MRILSHFGEWKNMANLHDKKKYDKTTTKGKVKKLPPNIERKKL